MLNKVNYVFRILTFILRIKVYVVSIGRLASFYSDIVWGNKINVFYHSLQHVQIDTEVIWDDAWQVEGLPRNLRAPPVSPRFHHNVSGYEQQLVYIASNGNILVHVSFMSNDPPLHCHESSHCGLFTQNEIVTKYADWLIVRG